MKAITTKYHGPTKTRGSRISATDGSKRITVPFDHGVDDRENHRLTMRDLVYAIGMSELTPSEQWHGGTINGGSSYVWVYVPVAE
jgi:hypothetical protein